MVRAFALVALALTPGAAAAQVSPASPPAASLAVSAPSAIPSPAAASPVLSGPRDPDAAPDDGAPSAAVGAVLPEFLPLPAGPAGTTLALVVMFLPMLVTIWLLVLLRTVQKTGEWRGATLRLAIAAELGVRPRELAGMPVSALRSLRDQLAFDDVTHVLNRPAGVAALEREISRARRRRQRLALAFLDVDDLKAVNDSAGHAAGDALLRRVAGAVTGGLRAEDLVFRFGGDEFVCVMPSTSGAEAHAVMERIHRRALRQACSFSFGVSELKAGDDEVALLGRADDRLYDSKRSRPDRARGPRRKAPLRERLGQRRLVTP